ncbi:hypothetical protein TWF481_011746 [Arthrobotrys musiformis]|uniref:Uncharacterized protein n=1 Tax=Arthrobotrys musiformis TaxID=47236 RepID=A0AAV9VWK0_9PEZI
MRRLLDYLITPEEQHFLKIYRKGCSTKEYSADTEKDFSRSTAPRRDNEFKSSIRLSGRVFLVGSIALTIVERLRLRAHRSSKPRLWDGLGVRIPLSLSVLLLLHRLCYHGVVRIQSKLLRLRGKPSARALRPLRKVLLSPVAPSGAAALSGVALASIPSEDARLIISIYFFTKTMEYLSNALCVSARTPWWFGSWALFPFSMAQLFHGLLNGQGDIPLIYRKALMTFPTSSTDKAQLHLTVTRMAEVARLQFPNFQSTIIFPRQEPISKAMKAAFREAHPAIRHLSCAISHPESVSCLWAWVSRQSGRRSSQLPP